MIYEHRVVQERKKGVVRGRAGSSGKVGMIIVICTFTPSTIRPLMIRHKCFARRAVVLFVTRNIWSDNRLQKYEKSKHYSTPSPFQTSPPKSQFTLRGRCFCPGNVTLFIMSPFSANPDSSAAAGSRVPINDSASAAGCGHNNRHGERTY